MSRAFCAVVFCVLVGGATPVSAAQESSPRQVLANGSVLADAARTDQVTVELRSAADARLQMTFRDGIADRLLPLVAENAQAQGFNSVTLMVLGSPDDAAWLGVNNCALYAGCLK